MITMRAVNIALELWGCLILGVICLYTLLYRRRPMLPRSRAFLMMGFTQILLLLSDALGLIYEGSHALLNFRMVRICSFMTMLLGYIMLALFSLYMAACIRETGNIPRAPLYAAQILVLCSSALVVISQFNQMYYRINLESVWVPGELYWLSQCLGILGMALNLVLLAVHGKQLPRHAKRTFWFQILAPVAALIINAFWQGFVLLNLINTLSLIMIFLFVQMGHAQKAILLSQQLVQQNAELAESRVKLAETRMDLMRSQIQPHFIFNTLGTIGELCHLQPQKAAEVVREFSLYLRGNLDELDCNSPIRLSREIEHARHYTAIERVRFPDMTIRYELHSSEFFLPALSIQPLVENAIKHGLMGLESGGTVIISTYETEYAYCVRVQDNGVGFDPQAPLRQTGRKHLGLANIRERLEIMCGGTLTINSAPGRGTVALISIPKEGAL